MRTRCLKAAPAAVLVLAAFATFLGSISPGAFAFSGSPGSLTGRTNRDGGAGCAVGGCHNGQSGAITVAITGSSTLAAGQSATFTVTTTRASTANGTRVGLAVAASDSPTPLAVFSGMPMALVGTSEIIHSAGVGALRTTTSNTATYQFTYTMPAAAAVDSTHTLYAVSPVSFLGWNHAPNFTVTTRPSATATATASNPTTSSIDLSWTGGGPNYRVVYKTGAVAPASETDGTQVNLGAVTSTTITGLAASTQYTFKVFSRNTGNTLFSTTGATATATTAAIVVGTRYVNAATGVNTGACTSAGSPCRTITYAMSQAVAGSPGDLVSVAPGTYNLALGEVFPIQFKSGVEMYSTGTPANTIIDAAGDTVKQGIIMVSGPVSGRIEGFTFANGLHEGSGGGIAQGGAVRIFSASSSFTVTRNVFSNNEARGEANGGIGLALGGALYVSFSTGISVNNNVFVGNIARGGSGTIGRVGEGGGIYFDSVTGSATNNTFRGNSAIGGTGSSSTGGNARGGGAAGNSTLTIVNNIFSANAATAGAGSPAGTATAGAAATASGSSSNNLSFGNLVNGGASTGDSLGTVTVTGDPLFHAAPTNLRILNASPAKGAGTATGAPATDFDGTGRPSPPSIGAFEASLVASSTAVASNLNPSTSGQSVTFTATVSSAGGTPAGTVTFKSGATPICSSVALASGQAQCATSSLSVATHSITAEYSGSTDYSPSASTVLSQVVQPLGNFALSVSKVGSGTVSSNPAGIDCGATCSANFTSGTPVTLSAVAASGFVFAGWSGDCTGTGSCQVTMSAARAVTASFTALTTFNVVINAAQEVPPNASAGGGTGTVTVNPVANTLTYSFSVTGLSGAIAGAHFHGPAARGANAGIKIDISGNSSSGTVGYSEADEADILGGLWYVNFHTAAFSTGEARGQLDSLPSPIALNVAKAGAGSGTVTSSPAGINCGSTCTGAYASATVVTLSATPTTGSILSGWSGGGCSGTGTCSVTLNATTTVTATFALATSIPRLANISTRGRVETGNDVMIGGFVIGGSTPKKVLITARGPSLTAFGVVGAMANPSLQLFSGQTVIASNDDWQTNANAADITATGIAPTNAQESALLLTLNPGAYTAIVSGVGGGTGVGIVEVFEQDRPDIPLINISTRGQVQTGDNVMIGGFIIYGDAPKTVLITARGPSLAPFGITNPLANPTLQLFSGQTLIGANDDFGTAPNLAAIQATGVAPTNALESAILVTLNPGAYTAIVSGVGGGTGVGIVEVFAQ